MLRRTTTCSVASSSSGGAFSNSRTLLLGAFSLGSAHAPTKPKYSDKPGMWGPQGGPVKDTLARRVDFYRLLAMHKVGKLTAPFRTKKAVWMFRKLQARLWKTTVLTLVFVSVLLIGNIWIMMVFHAYQIGPSTPILERKVREHRVSKQIMQMVRERERELTGETERRQAEHALENRDVAVAAAKTSALHNPTTVRAVEQK